MLVRGWELEDLRERECPMRSAAQLRRRPSRRPFTAGLIAVDKDVELEVVGWVAEARTLRGARGTRQYHPRLRPLPLLDERRPVCSRGAAMLIGPQERNGD